MIFFDILRQMFRSLWAHKLRSFLTMFGIAWGVGSLLLLVGLGEGFRSGNRRELNSIGEDIMFTFPGRAPAVAGNMSSSHEYRITYRDYLDVKDEAPHVRAVAPVLRRAGHPRGQRVRQLQRRSRGVFRHIFNQIRYLPLAAGRWINEADEAQKRNVAVIGDEMLKNLFPGGAYRGRQYDPAEWRALRNRRRVPSALGMATTTPPTIASSCPTRPCTSTSR